MSGDLLDRFGRYYPAGTVLFREGDAASEMFVIHSGSVKLTRRVRDREAVLAMLPPGEFFGEMGIINNRPRSATATVVEEAWLLVIDALTFEAMIRGKAEIAVRMIKTLASRLELANMQIELLLLKDANHRVVKALRQLAAHGRPGDSAVFIPVTLPELAARVGLDEYQVEAAIARLHEAGLVIPAQSAGLEGDGYVVPEVGRLVDFSEFLEVRERFEGVG